MRFDLYVDSYRRYKRGTDKIAEWLANAGRLCGVELSTKVWPGHKYRMPLSKFRDLADTIASCKEPEIEVRPELLDLLKEVISLREAATVFYRHNLSSNELFEQSNEGHCYTIQVLRDVLALLQPMKQTQPSARSTRTASEKDEPVGQVSNIFDALDLEDIAEPVVHLELTKGSQGKRASKKTKSRSRDSKDAIEVGSSTEELFFLLFCFFKDLHDVQDYISELWTGYKDGHVPLTSAATTTDLAFDVIRQKEDVLLQSEWVDGTDGSQKTIKDALAALQKTRTATAVPLYWKFDKEGTLLNHGFMGELLYSYMYDLNANKIGSNGKLNEFVQDRMYQMGDWLYTPAYVVLDCAAAVSGGSGVMPGGPQSISASFKKENRPVAVDCAKRCADNFETLMPIVQELIQLRAAGLDETIAADVWTKALCEMIDPHKEETKKRMGGRNNRQIRNTIPMWLAFATTVYLDIRTCLGSTAGRGFQELRNESQRSSKTVRQMLQWCRHHPDGAWTKQHFDVMESVQNTLRLHVEEDPVAKVNKLMGYPVGPTQSPHYLMRHHPLWAGIVTLWLQLSMWDATIEMTNIYTGTWQATHLYALSLTKELFDWPDMEYLINLHGPEHLFYGGRPTSVSECCRKHSLSLGMSAQMSAKDSHKGLKLSARGFPNAVRQHRPHVILTDLLNWRYAAVRMRAGQGEGPDKELPALELLLEFQKRKPEVALVKKDDNSAYLVPLLSLVQKAIAADVSHMAFNYFDMHQRCWNLLERLQEDLRDDLSMIGRLSGENYLGTDQMTLRHIPGVVFNCVSAIQSRGGINLRVAQLARMVMNTQEAVKHVAIEKGSVGLDAVSRTLATHVEELQPEASTSPVDTDDDEDDEKDLAILSAALDLAPKRFVNDEESRMAYKMAKKTPFNEWPPDAQEYVKQAQAKGADFSKGLMGILESGWKATGEFTPQQQQRVLATTTLKEYNDLLKTFEREDANKLPQIGTISDMMDAKKKRNNKNKNKNRKLKQKEARAAGDEDKSSNTIADAPANGNSSGSSSRVIGQRSSSSTWDFDPGTLPDQAAYEEAKRRGKMTIDGVEYTLDKSTYLGSFGP